MSVRISTRRATLLVRLLQVLGHLHQRLLERPMWCTAVAASCFPGRNNSATGSPVAS